METTPYSQAATSSVTTEITTRPPTSVFIKFIRIFLLVLIVFGIGLICTINMWVPNVVRMILRTDTISKTMPVSLIWKGSVDGEYVYDDHVNAYSEVVIGSSTQSELRYDIETSAKDVTGHPVGSLMGTAVVVAGTTTEMYSDTVTNDGCGVTITFIDPNHLSYVTKDLPGSHYGCSQYYGMGAFFVNNLIHTKNKAFPKKYIINRMNNGIY